MAPPILYYFPPSAPSRIALLTCRQLNLDVDIKTIDLGKKEQLNPEFVKLNPQHVVPTLDDNGFILWESRAIAQYLVETYAPDSTLYPKDTKKRALVNQRLQFDCGTFHQQIRACAHPILYLGETVIPEKAKQGVRDACKLMDEFLKDSDWFAGDTITLADLSIYGTLSSIVHLGADITPYKKLSAWYERCKELPGYKENEEGCKLYTARLLPKMTEPY